MRAIDRVIDQARKGGARSLVVRGEAGIGKSALLDHAAGGASDMIVLRARAWRPSRIWPSRASTASCGRCSASSTNCRETQSAALAGALGLAASTDADRFLVSAAVLGLLAAAADERPVLCVIDDAQWLDRPSVDALVFSARRLRAERLAMLFGARER